MYIDFKETVWSRVEIPEKLRVEVSMMINDGVTMQEIFDFIVEKKGDSTYDVIYDTSEFMTLKDNKGDSTIELYTEDGVLLSYNNEKFELGPKAENIKKAIIRCDGYCPCVANSIGKKEYLCPCEKFRIEEECCCNLYVKKEEK